MLVMNRQRSKTNDPGDVDELVEKAFRSSVSGKSGFSSRTPEDLLDDKKNELIEWVASRLLESSWYMQVTDSLTDKLDNYQAAQLYGNEKRIVDELLKSVGPDARNSLPDTIKMDLVKAVQDILQKNDDILKCFRRSE